MQATKSPVLQAYQGRVSEQYFVDQVNYHMDSETFRDWKDRMSNGDRLYLGQLNELFPDENALPDISLVENKFKNALHDISRLAAEGRGAVKFVARGEKDRDMKGARIRESINEGYWVTNYMVERERQLYLDLAGTSMMALACYADARSDYPAMMRLDPRYCFPDVADGKLTSMLYGTEIKERVAAKQFPRLELNDDPNNQNVVMLCVLYEDDEVTEAIVNRPENQSYITKRWRHDLECVPVAFQMLDSYDGKFHGLFDQLAGPLMVRNKIVRFLVDYLEQMAHAPIFEEGVENWDAEPGPLTVYHGDPTAERVSMSRIQPGAPAGAVFGLIQYMGDQEEKEALQPPARSGNVSQSIASGSFVDRTQGQLTSVVKELQDKMASLRRQANYVCMKIDEKHLDYPKPLVRGVARKTEYTPSEDIDGWYIHEVKFGAGAGLDRLNADNRVMNHRAARLISREEARAEIDYLDDDASSQDKIDREDLADALLQRFARDPAVPLSAVARTWLIMKKEGKSLDEALEETVPEILAAEQAQTQAPPEAEVPETGVPGPTPGMEQMQPGQELLPELGMQKPPLLMLQGRRA